MRGWRGWQLCQPETNCWCNLRSKPTLCHMDSWSGESNNYTQHVVKADMDLDTKNPSPHFWTTKPLWQASGAFPPFAWSWSHPNGKNGCKKTSLVAQMMCIEILIYSYPMSGLFMVIFLHVPSKTTHMCAFSIISPWIQSSNHPNLPVEGRLDHRRPDLQISSSLSTGIL